MNSQDLKTSFSVITIKYPIIPTCTTESKNFNHNKNYIHDINS
jgi:hypothetical protein